MKNVVLVMSLFFTTTLHANPNVIEPGASVNVGGQTYTCSAIPVTELLPRCYTYLSSSGYSMYRSNGSEVFLETINSSFTPILDAKKRDYNQKPKKFLSLNANQDAPYRHIRAGIRLIYEGIVEESFYFEEPTNATNYLRTLLQQKKCKLPEEK